MRKSLLIAAVLLMVVALTLPLGAQETTPEATPDMMATDQVTGDDMGAMMSDPAITVMDQAVLNGMVTIGNVDAPVAGFVVIHADENGAPGHVVGVAPIPQGVTDNLAVMIDGAMSTPVLHAMLHVDDSEPGVFEFIENPSADAPVSGNFTSFRIAAIFSFDQQPIENTVIIASAILADGGWLVVHADSNGSPGPVLGQALLNPGTNPAVIIPLAPEGQTQVVWPMLHVDDNSVGTYEFGQVEGADAPVTVNGQVVTRPMNLTDAPTILLADGSVLNTSTVPYLIPAAGQSLDTMTPGGAGELTMDSVLSVGPGFIDVHADMNGHPAVSLGHVAVPDGESTGVAVPLQVPPTMPDMAITPMVWPMLHADTNANGTYEYLKIVGADLPVVYNGAVVTVPTMVGAAMMSPDGSMDMTPEVTPAG